MEKLLPTILTATCLLGCDINERVNPAGTCHLPQITLSQGQTSKSVAECVANRMAKSFIKNAYWKAGFDSTKKNYTAVAHTACVSYPDLAKYIHDYLASPQSCDAPPTSWKQYLSDGSLNFLPPSSLIINSMIDQKVDLGGSGEVFSYIDHKGFMCAVYVGFQVAGHPVFYYGENQEDDQREAEKECGKLAVPFAADCPILASTNKLDPDLKCLQSNAIQISIQNPEIISSVVCMDTNATFPHMACNAVDDGAEYYMEALAASQLDGCDYPSCARDFVFSRDRQEICGIALRNTAAYSGSAQYYDLQNSLKKLGMNCIKIP